MEDQFFQLTMDHDYMTATSSLDLMNERPNYSSNPPIPIKKRAFINPHKELRG